MLIDFNILKPYMIRPLTGIIHVGAHELEERNGYIQHFGMNDDKIIWIDALQCKVDEMKLKFPQSKIYSVCMSDTDDEIVKFFISSNYQSSSILPMKTHLIEHPHISIIDTILLSTKTMKTFFDDEKLDKDSYNFLNLDVQGAELKILHGMGNMLSKIDYIYTEVNTSELYENCCLLSELDSFLNEKGFCRILTDMTPHGWGDAFYVRYY